MRFQGIANFRRRVLKREVGNRVDKLGNIVKIEKNVIIVETVATLPGDMGSIHIAEALKRVTSRAGGKPTVIARGPKPCSPGFLGPIRDLAPDFLATVSVCLTVSEELATPAENLSSMGKKRSQDIIRKGSGPSV